MELQLISASSAAGEPADCTLVYRLDEDSGRGLPVVNETHPWAGKTICALRDRSGGVPRTRPLYSFHAIICVNSFLV